MLRGVAADATRTNEPPTRLKTLPWGKTKTRDGLLVVNEQSGEIIRQRMSAQRRDRVRIDREHATAFEPALARKTEDILGYGDVEVVKGEGIFLTNIDWTADISLAPRLDIRGRDDADKCPAHSPHENRRNLHSIARQRFRASPRFVERAGASRSALAKPEQPALAPLA